MLKILLQMEENVLCVDVQLNNLSIMYDHKDWELLLYNSENDISKPVSNISLKDRLSSFEITLNAELYDSSLNIKLPDVQETSCGVAHMKFALNSIGRLCFFFFFTSIMNQIVSVYIIISVIRFL